MLKILEFVLNVFEITTNNVPANIGRVADSDSRFAKKIFEITTIDDGTKTEWE
jgi:hypothetical protein